jgi:hypothetical protein
VLRLPHRLHLLLRFCRQPYLAVGSPWASPSTVRSSVVIFVLSLSSLPGCLRVLDRLRRYVVSHQFYSATVGPFHGMSVSDCSAVSVYLCWVFVSRPWSMKAFSRSPIGPLKGVYQVSCFLPFPCAFSWSASRVYSSTWTSVASRLVWGPFTSIWSQLFTGAFSDGFISLRRPVSPHR